ncbi:MAG: right-handed parallel beta-helix repeat-containing protein, partial [Planctomycetes bacterium]|nr:right-handed parallel beta-helix repeat-containing protein [Planctomycetota bacterium]
MVEYTFGGDAYANDRPYAVWAASGTSLEMSNCELRSNACDAIYSEGSLSMVNTTVSRNGRDGVYSSGTLSILGSRFTDNGRQGVQAAGTGAVIMNSVFSDNAGTGLYITGNGCTVVADTCFGNQHGLDLADGVFPVEFYDNKSDSNTICEYIVEVEDVDNVWLDNECQQDGLIGIRPGNVAGPTQWVDDYVYQVCGDITVPHDISLTLEPGLIMKFTADDGLYVNGLLIAEGVEGDEIVFTSYYDDEYGGDTSGGASSGSPGNWPHIKFSNTNAGCVLQHCKIRFAGQTHDTYYREAVIVDSGAHLSMTNCEVEQTGGGVSYPYAVKVNSGAYCQMSNCYVHDNVGYGVYINEPTTLVTGCLAENNSQAGFYVHPELAGEVAADNSLSGNYRANSIWLLDGAIAEDDVWPRTYTVLVNGNVTINPGATVTIDKGTVVKFNGNRTLNVQGGLYAEGDGIDKIIFSSYKDDAYGGDTNENGANNLPQPGDWGGIVFNGTEAAELYWALVSYGGYNNVPAVKVDACSLSFSQCIVHSNLNRGIQVSATGYLSFTNSDIYGNGYGIENLNTGAQVDARSCWWGNVSGPFHPTLNPGGLGNQVSDNVLFEPELDRSIDNPWVTLGSPAASGNFDAVLVFDLDGDELMDLAAGTLANGIRIYRRTGFETWESLPSPVTEGQCSALDGDDYENDGDEDLLAAGSDGIRLLANDGAGVLTETSHLLIGEGISDARFAYMDADQYLDVVACSSNNGGIWVFYGDGGTSWTQGNRPATTGTFNHVAVEFLNYEDTRRDIVATSGESQGIRMWDGEEDDTWTELAPLENGRALLGLDMGDIDKNGFYDIVAGSSDQNVGIVIYLNDGVGGWTPLAGPTTTGRYDDLVLALLNEDTWLDLVGANHLGGISVWTGTSSLLWNYWYHQGTGFDVNDICVDDLTLDGAPDLVGATQNNGIFIWENQAPGTGLQYFQTAPNSIDFGPVAIGNCAHDDFQLTNTSPDTLRNVYVYTSNPAVFEVSFMTREEGPFDMAPGESKPFEVTYCPVEPVVENELVIIHCPQAITNVRVTGEGVTQILPLWTMDIQVENAVGDSANSRTLTFGGGIGATDSLDVEAGEVCMPPWPPSGVFDARLEVIGCDDGSMTSIHDYYLETDSFKFSWHEGDGGYPVTISWNPNALPDGTFLLSDEVGGAFVDTLNMADTSQVVIASPIAGDLVITTARNSLFEYDLDAGWHLLSRAVTANNDSLDVLFPGAVSAFRWADGYVQVDQLAIGSGYWVDMDVETVVSHSGQQVRSVERFLSEGWSLVGALYDTLDVIDIQESPPDCIVSIFGFDWQYYEADALLPGHGYWF